MTYQEYRRQRQEEFNALPLFYAFSDRQLKEQMEKRGLTINDTDKICTVGAGSFCLKSDMDAIREYCDKPDLLPELMKDPAFAEDAFYYEMCNHEYGINWQGDWDVCLCFGDCKYAEDKNGTDYLREMGYGDDMVGAYLRAKRRYYKDAEEKEWF
ncbi:MAG: hypothetical protein IJG15_04930 [Lachnospiraceae bacterium]|nr:hypothetical protein [Lachnospiraceae bacterium]